MDYPSGTPAHTLAEEIEVAAELTACLRAEQQQLQAIDADALPQTIIGKNVLVARLTTLSGRRHRALSAAGYPASEAGMQSWLEEAQEAQPARPAWEQLREAMRRAQELNNTNGILINSQLARTRQALSILNQQPEGSVYGPDGQQNVKTGNRGYVIG
jgi:flagellar biosynthesis protein FlgN